LGIISSGDILHEEVDQPALALKDGQHPQGFACRLWRRRRGRWRRRMQDVLHLARDGGILTNSLKSFQRQAEASEATRTGEVKQEQDDDASERQQRGNKRVHRGDTPTSRQFFLVSRRDCFIRIGSEIEKLMRSKPASLESFLTAFQPRAIQKSVDRD